jgi:phage shock protein PspC (stress-responsive transcriptional regulator)
MEQTDPTTRPSTDGAEAPFSVPPFSVPQAEVPAPEQARPTFRLRRSRTERMLGGVCGGLAESLDIDPALLRITVVALTVLGVGVTIPIYAAIWLLAPETDSP